MFCNNNPKQPELTRLFPYIMYKLAPDLFNFDFCTFTNSKDKVGTGRVVVWKMIKAPAVSTLEISLCGGASEGKFKHFT